MNKERLIEVLEVQTETGDDFLMYHFLTKEFEAKGYTFFTDNGNLYVIKGKADYYPCVVAHTDTVHEIVEDLTVVQVKDNLTGFNAEHMEQTGIGGDDKVGIYIALECLDRFENIKAAFFRDEEVGCQGSYLANEDFFRDCGYVLQCDRQGNRDFITVASGTILSSREFQKAIKPIIKAWGYDFKEGYMTDVMALKENGIPISMANMSCGYYNPHSSDEFVNMSDVSACLDMVIQIIDSLGETLYEHQYEHKQEYFKTSIPFGADYKPVHDCECCGNPIRDQFDLHYLREFETWVCADCWGWARKWDEDAGIKKQTPKLSAQEEADNYWENEYKETQKRLTEEIKKDKEKKKSFRKKQNKALW